MALLTKTELKELEVVRRKIDIVTNEYLLDPNDPNFDFIRKKYFDGYKQEDAIRKTRLHNVGSGVGYSVASVISYFNGNPVGELDLDLTMATQDIVGSGYGAIVLEKQDGVYKSSYIPAYNYVLRDGQHYVYRFYASERADNQDILDLYVLEQLYGVAGTEGFIKNRLLRFEAASLDLSIISDQNGQQVSLDSIEQTAGMQEIVKTGLDVPAIFVPSFRENVCENISLIDKIRNLIYSIDRNMVEFDNQFGMNMQQFVLFKNIQPNHVIAKNIKDGRLVDGNKLGRYHFSREKDADISFVSNKNEMIDQSMEYEKEKYKKVSGITSVPLDFLQGEASAGAIGVGSRSILHGAFIKQIKTYRELWTPIINEIYEAVSKADSSLETEWVWPDMFAKDENELVLELSSAIKSGLISQRKAVMKYQGIDEDELEEEILRITEDNLLVTNGNINEKSGNQALNGDGESEEPEGDDV